MALLAIEELLALEYTLLDRVVLAIFAYMTGS